MEFEKVDLEVILGEIANLPSDWMDDDARKLVAAIPEIVDRIRGFGTKLNTKHLVTLLRDFPLALDVLRLITGEGQEPMAHRICDALEGKRRNWTTLRRLASSKPELMADALVRTGLPELVTEQISRSWTIADVLIDRYKMGKGRAIAGQRRGRALENEVEAILKKIAVPYEARVTFTNAAGIHAKCDFAIPSRNAPKIVIEAKGYEATGSKLTDFLGDVGKIKLAKGYHTYFFVVTDGRGWFNRESDLKQLVKFHHEQTIDMIYTRARLPQLAKDIERIVQREL